MKSPAKIVPNYGMRPVGGFGIRGVQGSLWRLRLLSRLYLNVRGAQYRRDIHRCPTS